jgi:hypothetical protein
MPVAVVRPRTFVDVAKHAKDVLHHARFLIVGFLDEKGIVLDALGRRVVRRFAGEWPCAREPTGQRGQGEPAGAWSESFR